jgi:hypothetical protein
VTVASFWGDLRGASSLRSNAWLSLAFVGAGMVLLHRCALESGRALPHDPRTMFQASVARTMLAAKTPGKNSAQLRLRQGAAEGSAVVTFMWLIFQGCGPARACYRACHCTAMNKALPIGHNCPPAPASPARGEDAIDQEFSAVCRAIWGFILDDFTDEDLSAEDHAWLDELTRECAVDFAAEQDYDLRDYVHGGCVAGWWGSTWMILAEARGVLTPEKRAAAWPRHGEKTWWA